MRMTFATVSTPLLLAAMSCSDSQQRVRAEVQSFVKTFVEAGNRGDVTAVMEMYSRKPVAASIADGEISRGWDAIRVDNEQGVGAEGASKLSLGVVEVVPLSNDHALVYSAATLSLSNRRERVQIPAALTLVVEKSPSGWKILHEHTSTAGE